jgi:hypothetical protein
MPRTRMRLPPNSVMGMEKNSLYSRPVKMENAAMSTMQ